MLNLLIVDDEPMFREGLIRTVNWDSLGINIVGEAYNGVEALKILETEPIDLVFTDIKMPEMDGLELIRWAVKVKPQVRFVVLSSFDEFQLVKKAFRLGIVDYILKSEIKESELESILNRQTEELLLRQNGKQVHPTAYIDRNNQLFLQQLLKKCVDEKSSLQSVLEVKKVFSKPKNSSIAVVELKIRNTDFSCQQKKVRKNIELARKALEEFLFLEDRWIAYPDGNCCVCFYRSAASLSWRDFCESAEGLRQRAELDLQESYPAMILSAGLSSLDHTEIPFQPRNEARLAGAYSFFRGISSLINFGQYQQSLNNKSVNTDNIIKDFAGLLRNRDLRSVSSDIKRFLVSPHHCRGDAYIDIAELYRKYYYHLLAFSEQMNMDEDEEINIMLGEFLTMEASGAALSLLNDWLGRTVRKILEKLEGYNSLTRQVVRYLQKHYNREISLTEVADVFQVNPSYLSRLFSKEMKLGFSVYLNELRINKAMELMAQGNYKMYEVAERVGFSNPESFSRIFKKITGKSPKEY